MSDICVHGRWIERGCSNCCDEVVELRKRMKLVRRVLRESIDVSLFSAVGQRTFYLTDALDLRRKLPRKLP